MGRHPSKISRIESGAATPSPADIMAWCKHCGATDQLEDLLAARRTVEGVLIEYERLEASGFESSQQRILPMYSTTTTFRAYSSWLIPGILQTEAYTRAVWRLLIERRGIEDDIDDAMPARLARQRALLDKRRRFAFLLEECVLRTGFGGPEIMLDQLGRLLAVSTMSNVALGILPMSPSRKACRSRTSGFSTTNASRLSWSPATFATPRGETYRCTSWRSTLCAMRRFLVATLGR